MSGPGQVAGMPGRGEISLGARFVLLAGLSLALIVVDHRQDQLSRVREVLSLAVHPIYVVVDFPFNAWQSITGAVSDRRALMSENARLRRQVMISQYRLQDLSVLELENDRLRDRLHQMELEQNRQQAEAAKRSAVVMVKTAPSRATIFRRFGG